MIGPVHYKFDKLQNARLNMKKTFLEAWYGTFTYYVNFESLNFVV